MATSGTNVSFRTNAETNARRRSSRAVRAQSSADDESRVTADNLSTNDIDRVMQSRPWRQMQDERAAGMFGEFKLNPRVEAVQMDADDARRPETIPRGERSLIEGGEPAVRHRHLAVQSG